MYSSRHKATRTSRQWWRSTQPSQTGIRWCYYHSSTECFSELTDINSTPTVVSWATHSLQTLAVPNIGWCVCAIIPNDIDPPQSNSNTNWKLMSKSHCHLSVASSPMFLTKRPSHKGNSELTKEIHIRCLGAYFVSWFSSEGIRTVVSTVMLLYVKRLVLSHETKMKRAITKFGQKFMIAASYKRIYL